MMTLNDILKIIVGFIFPLVIIIYCNTAIVHFVITAMKVCQYTEVNSLLELPASNTFYLLLYKRSL